MSRVSGILPLLWTGMLSAGRPIKYSTLYNGGSKYQTVRVSGVTLQ
jgi:hypothetical protein